MKILKSYFFIICIFLSLLFISACNTTKSTLSTNVYSVQDSLSDKQKFEFKYQFFKANQYSLEQKYDMSLSMFNSCLRIDPYSSATHYKMASIYILQNDLTLAEQHIDLAVLYNSDNIWYLYLAGSIYSMNNKNDKAKQAYLQLIEKSPDEIDFYFHLADVYLKDKDYQGSIDVSNQIEQKFGISESISLQKYKLYLAQNKNKEALNELTNLSNSAPNNISYKRYIADYYMQIKSIDKAIDIYNSILKDIPNDGLSHIGLADCYRTKGEYDTSIEHIKIAFLSDDLPSDIKFNILISLLQIADNYPKLKSDIYILSESLYKQYPDNIDIITIYANFQLQKNNLKFARELLIKVVETRKDKYAVWEQLILLDNEFSDWESIYKHSNEAITYFPNQSFLYFFKGFSSFLLKDYTTAVNSLTFGLKLITTDDPLKSDFLSYLGEAYYQDGQKTNAYSTFDKLLIIDKENIMVLNNYAYYLSLDNNNLDKAESMSLVTITAEPKNPTYLDTYAWILFMRGKYEKALIYIEKSILYDKEPSDVVLEHYGDILFHNNNLISALEQWNKAKLLGEGSGLLDKKINGKKYFK